MLVNFKRLKGWDFFFISFFFVVFVLFFYFLFYIFLGGGGSFKQWAYMGVGKGAYLWKKVI